MTVNSARDEILRVVQNAMDQVDRLRERGVILHSVTTEQYARHVVNDLLNDMAAKSGQPRVPALLPPVDLPELFHG